jgi:uncharacterized protein (TIGR03437 family)
MLRLSLSILALAISSSAATLPLYFEPAPPDPNHPEPMRYLSRGNGVTSYLAGSETAFSIGDTRVVMKLVGAERGTPEAVDKLPGTSSYFIGNNPKAWRTGVPQYAKIVYRGVYPGVDLVYYGDHGNLEYDFRVAPGGDPTQIHIAYEGATGVALDQSGNVVLSTAAGEIRQRSPHVYQETAGSRKTVRANYRLEGRNTLGLALGKYDPQLPLVIDPVLEYATYFGGGGPDTANAVKTDSTGSVYIAGSIATPQFAGDPFSPASTSPYSDTTAVVIKFAPDQNTIQYVAQIGGDGQSVATHLAIDSLGALYITGQTNSTHFPVVSAVDDTNKAGSFTPFVTKLASDGQTLIYSTYFGGTGLDTAGGITVNAAGMALVTGQAAAPDFPLTDSSVTTARGSKAYLARFNPDGTLNFSKLFGGTANTKGTAIALDNNSNIYVVGTTTAPDFPTKGAFQSNFLKDPLIGPILGLRASFATKFSSDGATLLYSTLFGGTGDDAASGAAVDAQGNLFMAGSTSSTDLTIMNSVQSSNAGGKDGFIAELGPQGNTLLFSTYFGGSRNDAISAIALDNNGNIHVTGSTTSSDLPMVKAVGLKTKDANATRINNVFAAKLSPNGQGIVYTTTLGGSEDDSASGITVDSNGSAYVVGTTSSPDLPVAGAFQATYGGNYDMFLVKLDADMVAPSSLSVLPISLNFTMTAGGTAPPPQLLNVAGLMGATVSYTSVFSPNGSWLSVTAPSGSTPDQLAVSVTAMPIGSYTGSIQFTAAGDGSTVNVPVVFQVIPQTPVLTSVTPNHFDSIVFNPIAPATLPTVTLTITGSGFVPGAIASLKRFPYGDAEEFSATLVDSNTLQITIPVTSQAAPISIAVSNPGTQQSNPLNVMQGSVTPIVNGVFNSATSKASVSAGDSVNIIGFNLGPVIPAVSHGVVPQLGDTQVLFDGVPAQLLLTFDFGIRAIIPNNVSGKTQTQVVVVFLGHASAPFLLALNGNPQPSTDPFGVGNSGILNEDGSINSPSNPAAIGSKIIIVLDVHLNMMDQLGSVAVGGVPAPFVGFNGTVIGYPSKLISRVQIPAGVPSGPAVPVALNFIDPVKEVDISVAIQ